MLKSRLSSTSKKLNSLNNEVLSMQSGITALGKATYDMYEKEEAKIFHSIEKLERKINDLENELLIFEKAENDIGDDIDLNKKYEDQIDKILEALENGREALWDLKAHQKRFKSMKQVTEPKMEIPGRTRTEPEIEVQMDKMSMPMIKIPKFKGVRWEWPNFWTIFEEVIGKSHMSDLLKLNNLLMHLEGEAKELAGRYQLASENYPKVVELLKERYADRTATINELNKRLMEATSSDFRIPAQRRLWDVVRTILDQLRGLGQEVDNEMLKNMVLKKFNFSIQEAVYRDKMDLGDDTKWSMEQMSRDIESTIKRNEYLAMQMGREEKRGSERDESKAKQRSPKQNEPWKRQKIECILCGKPHFSSMCRTITDVHERLKIIQQKKACKGCYRIEPAHGKNECEGNFLCRECNDKHHYTLCVKKKQTSSQGQNAAKKTEDSRHASSSKKHMNVTTIRKESEGTNDIEKGDQRQYVMSTASDTSYLATLKTEAYNQRSEKWDFITILIDCGASQTFIDEELMESFQLPVLKKKNFLLQTFGDEEPEEKTYAKTKIKIKLPSEIIEVKAIVAKTLAGSMQKAPLSDEDKTFIMMNGLRLNEDSLGTKVKPNMILGTDFLKRIWQGKMVELPSGLNLLKTALGYATIGRADTELIETSEENEKHSIFVAVSAEETEATEIVNRDIEDRQRNDMSMKSSKEFSGPLKEEKAQMERETRRHFKATIEKREDGYYVRFPFKEHEGIPDNKPICVKRLVNVTKYHNTEVLKMIDDIFNDQLSKNIIEIVLDESQWKGLLHYNPHQPVLTPQKTTTKCRVVIDGSSHFKDKLSLNDIIKQGPVILPDLVEMLIRFRAGRTVMLSDVEKAFLQVHLHEDDRDATRVLWLKDYRQPPTPDNIVVYRFTRVLFGLNVSPFLLGATIEHHFESHPNRELAQEISTNLYVDNLILTTDGDLTTALQLYRESKDAFSDMKMNLREFLSNSEEFNESIDEKDRAKDLSTKVLGIEWNAETDEMRYAIKIEKSIVNSRRTVASTIAGIFDPLGKLVPLILPMKLFQRKLWNETYGWDTPLTEEDDKEWNQSIEAVNQFVKTLPRHVINNRDQIDW
ncbi:hypothetical protein CRE_09851 [Caenorhabditis remanei]|uniref:Reverse transcriptase domain-containing protein n=1 Tax=Caenorhabditis remanei TaxID=31234 RepID=E3NJZ0_CAERE|nr:hypothetical protein CRE_09851 [Caenorhabditis remanei]